MTSYDLVGKKTVFIGSEQFDPELVVDEAAEITVTPQTIDFSSQEGTVSIPNGAFDEISGHVSLIIPNVQTLMRIFPNLAVPATYNQGKTGQVRFGAAECKTQDPVPIVIHNTCDNGSAQDIRIPAALIQNGLDFTMSQGDPTTLDVNFTPMKTPEGYVIFGEGMLDSASRYDPETMKYVKLDTAQQVSNALAASPITGNTSNNKDNNK